LENKAPKLRSHLENYLEKQIDEIIHRSKFTKLDILLKEMRKKAKENGLTEEILNDILNEDD
jgi:hypothetical protein